MSKVLSDFRAVGTYDHANGRVEITSDINGFLTATESATLGNGGNDPQGVNFYLKVVRSDAVLNAQNLNTQNVSFETGEWSYDLSGGTVYFERQTTESSSVNSSDPVNFGTDADGVEVYGAISPSLFNTKQELSENASSIVVNTVTETAISPEATFTPISSSATAIGRVSGRMDMLGDTNTGNLLTIINLQYQDAGGVWQTLKTKPFGYQSITTTGTPKYFFSQDMDFALDQSRVNASGEWQLRLSCINQHGTTTTTHFYTDFYIQQN